MFVKILYFAVFVGLGIAILRYRKVVFEWTGQWYWAEKHIWRGGTILVITLIGVGMIFFWVAYPLWAFENFGKRQGWGTFESAYDQPESPSLNGESNSETR